MLMARPPRWAARSPSTISPPRPAEPGLYRTVTGAEAISLGLVAGAKLAGLPMFFGGYPITPASAILHHLSRLKEYGVTTFQAEDEIAAISASIGASFAGSLGVTSSSGPGIALKTEAMGLAIMTELPLVIVNSQRGGPSTGLPTKTEQSDLYQAVYGRNADSPMPVIAARSPADAFDCAIEACRIAVQYMTPVMLLTDGYIANAAEPWKVPDMADYQPFPVAFHDAPPAEGEAVNPYKRDAKLARVWIKPGTPALMHRIGGIEKNVGTGHIDYASGQPPGDDRHPRRQDAGRRRLLPGPGGLPRRRRAASWRWSAGARPSARSTRRSAAPARSGLDASHIHLRHIWPLPKNLGDLLRSYERIIVPEMNKGQFKTLLRDQYLVDARPVNKVSGQPFKIAEIEAAIEEALAMKPPSLIMLRRDADRRRDPDLSICH